MIDSESDSESESEKDGGGEGGGGGDEGLESCIGHTPLFQIRSLSERTGCEIWGKAEFMNGCGGSVKDRVALKMIVTVRQNLLFLSFMGGIC